ncbi:MAG TPA: phage portal protein [Syntrophobacter fumaroxidans]|nr:phage portal protein [Syntrophobacter fumaroxidans]
MGIFDLFRRNRAERGFQKLQEIGLSEGATKSGQFVTESSCLAIPAVYACTRILAESISSMPLVLFRQLPNGDRTRAVEHPLNYIMHRKPNPLQTSLEFREYLVACICLRGNAYGYIERDHGEIIAVWPLHPTRMQVRLLEGNVLEYVYSDKGSTRRFSADEILHLKGLSTDGVIGLSPLSTLRETFGSSQALQEYSSKFFSNAARPAGVLSHPAKLGDEAYNRLKKSWNKRHGGSENTGSTVILEEGMTWQSISLTNEDAQMLESRKFTLEEIARCYRIPPHLVGHLDKMSYNNIEQLASEFLTLTLTPWLCRFEQRLDAQLLTEQERTEGYYFEHISGGLLRGGTLQRYQAYEIALRSGFLSRNEIRSLEGYNQVSGGDALGQVGGT